MLLVSKYKCNKCNTILESLSRHDFKECKCGSLSLDGGLYYQRVLYYDSDDVTDLSLTSKSPFYEVRQQFKRGTYGKDGKEPLHYVVLAKIDDEWLDSIIKYEECRKGAFIDIYKKEKEWRAEFGNKIE